jgi:hypothetical protein
VQGQEGEIYRLTESGVEVFQGDQAAPEWRLLKGW